MSNTALFRAKAPGIMNKLMADVGWDAESAASDLGNLGQECGGFTLLQEQKPTVAGSQGGFGWYQWTGPRRRAYFAWCKRTALKPEGDAANYGFHIVELKGEYKDVTAKVALAKGLANKVKAFERGYERAGKPNYPGRLQWAKIALDAWNASNGKAPAPKSAAPASPAAPEVDKATIERVQRQLKDLGYTEVGGVDGSIGTMTATAIRVFRADNGLPAGAGIDDALLLALQKAPPRKLSPARENAGADVVRDKVPEVHTNWLTKVGAFFTGIAALIGSFFDGIIGNLGAASGYIQPVKDAAGDVPGWVWMLAIAAIAGGLFLVARHGEAKGVEAFQSGARR